MKIIPFLKQCGVSDIVNFLEKCEKLKSLLIEENSKYNLTRILSDFDYWNKHIADSASMGIFFKEKLEQHLRIADIGCGAGFPSIVLALAFPKTEITAIDSTGKKTQFVKLIKDQLGIKNLYVETVRAREYKPSVKFDIVTARAVGEVIKIFKESKNYLKKGGSFIFYQTPAIKEKLEELNKATSIYQINWQTTEAFVLPGGESRIFIYAET